MEFQKYYSDYSIFICWTFSGTVILAGYVNDILLNRSDVDGIEKLKSILRLSLCPKTWTCQDIFMGLKLLIEK